MTFGTINGHAFTFHEGIIFSLTSFHGRGFFPGGISLDDPITTIAAIEAVIGLIIEVSFIGATRSPETVAQQRGMGGIPQGMTTVCSLVGANSYLSW